MSAGNILSSLSLAPIILPPPAAGGTVVEVGVHAQMLALRRIDPLEALQGNRVLAMEKGVQKAAARDMACWEIV